MNSMNLQSVKTNLTPSIPIQKTMKRLKFISPFLCLLLSFLANKAGAAVISWDPNGTTSIGGSGTWDTSGLNWSTSTSEAQVSTGSLVAWNNATGVTNAACFSAGPSSGSSQGTFTIAVNSAINMGGIYNGALNPGSDFLTFSGTGSFNLASGQASFDTAGTVAGTTTIIIPITGVGPLASQGSGSLFLFGTNTYSGGTSLQGTGGVNFDNNGSFGTGPITWGVSGTVLATPANDSHGNTGATGPITITNSVVTISGSQIIVGLAGAPLTFSGPWTLPASGTVSLQYQPVSTTMTISGVIGGAAGFTKTGVGTLVLSGANTNSGQTVIANGLLSVNSLNKVTSGSASSSLGHPTTAANGTIGLGATTTAGTLIYTGVGETTDRVLNLAGTTGGATIENDGSGPVTFTSALTASGAASKTLTIQGTSTAANTIAGVIVNNSSANKTSLTKAQGGTWVLSGANTYTGNTSVTGGTLDLASGGSIGASAVSVSSGATLGSVTTSTTSIGGNTTLSSGGKASFTAAGGVSTSVGKISVTGNITLNNNVLTVNVTGSPLAAGTYRLMDCTGSLSGSANATPTITGTALASGYTATISTTAIAAGHVDLIVKATPTFSGLTASQSIIYSTTSIALSGTLSSTTGPTTVYAASGDTVIAKINGHTVSGTVSGSAGNFSITYNDPSLATDGVLGSPYKITYSYAGDAAAFVNAAANDTSTALTVTPAALSVTANSQTKTYGQTVTTVGSSQFITSALQNGEVVGSVTLTVSGSGDTATAPVAGSPYTITPSAATGGTFNPANYNITYNTGSLTVNPLVVNLTGTRAPDGSTDAAAGILTVANKVGSDTVNVALGSGTLAGSNLGLRSITSFGTLALGNAGGQGNANGTGSAAQFNLPSGAAVDSTGSLYVADTANNAIREVTPAGVVTTLSFTGLNNPVGVAVDAAGDVFVADTGNNQIVELPFGGSQTTLAITGLKYPAGVAVDAAGDVFVADTGNSQIVELPFGGSQTTLAITGLNGPSSVAVDAAGDIFVADTDNNQIVELPFGGSQTTLAFTGLSNPFGVAIDGAGDVFVTDKGNDRVVELSGGTQTTLALTGFNVNGPYGVAVDSTGNVLVTDSANNQIEE